MAQFRSNMHGTVEGLQIASAPKSLHERLADHETKCRVTSDPNMVSLLLLRN